MITRSTIVKNPIASTTASSSRHASQTDARPGGTSSLATEEMSAWRSFVDTQAGLISAIESDLSSTGLTLGDYQVLVFLSEAPGRKMRMCDLADALQLSPSGLTRRLDGIVRKGWVERRGCAEDRRVMLAVLTEDGFDQLTAAAPTHVDSVRRRLIDLLDTHEIECMTAICGKVRAALDADDT